MTIHLSKLDDGVLLVQARLEGQDGSVGDMVREVRPGGTFAGKTYDELLALAPGAVEIADPDETATPG